jgi:hypothetical protein
MHFCTTLRFGMCTERVCRGSDGLYVLQLNADGLEDQLDVVGAATNVIDEQTKITP